MEWNPKQKIVDGFAYDCWTVDVEGWTVEWFFGSIEATAPGRTVADWCVEDGEIVAEIQDAEQGTWSDCAQRRHIPVSVIRAMLKFQDNPPGRRS
jgi:hypothetical protein